MSGRSDPGDRSRVLTAPQMRLQVTRMPLSARNSLARPSWRSVENAYHWSARSSSPRRRDVRLQYAPLCRRHHRLKTHGGWRYTLVEPGVWLWSDPHGQQFVRDDTGTLDVTPPDRPVNRGSP